MYFILTLFTTSSGTSPGGRAAPMQTPQGPEGAAQRPAPELRRKVLQAVHQDVETELPEVAPDILEIPRKGISHIMCIDIKYIYTHMYSICVCKYVYIYMCTSGREYMGMYYIYYIRMYVCVRDCEGVVVWLLLEKYVLSFHF
jgi:hypothetical protein